MSLLSRKWSLRHSADPAGGISAPGISATNLKWRAWETLTCKGTPPRVRSGHASVLDSTGTHMYVFGGYHNQVCYSDLFRLHLPSMTWSCVKTTGGAPARTASHSAAVIGDKLVVFGGSGVPFGYNNRNKVHILDLNTRIWREVPAEGRRFEDDVPSPRYGQTLVAGPDGNALYVFGGTSGHIFSSELFRFDIRTQVWERVSARNRYSDGPPACYKHEAVVWEGKMYIIGGGDPNPRLGEAVQIYAFDFDTQRWEVVKVEGLPTPGLDVPCARRSHSCVVHNGTIYMCGGTDGERMFNDLWAFELSTRRWQKMPKEGFVAKYFHTAVITPAGRMFVFGGCIDAEGTQRTSDVVSVWLGAFPTLTDMCLDAIAGFGNVREDELTEYDLPEHLIDRVLENQGVTAKPSATSVSLRQWLVAPATLMHSLLNVGSTSSHSNDAF